MSAQEHSYIYQKYRQEYRDTYDTIVEFYEVNRDQIIHLDIDEQFLLLYDYVDACFECGYYEKVSKRVDRLIEWSIMHNFDDVNASDPYKHMLFKKAAASFQLDDLVTTEHVCLELLKMNPKDYKTSLLLKKCRLKKYPYIIEQLGGAKGLLVLFSVLLFSVELIGSYVLLSTPTITRELNHVSAVFSISLICIANYFILRGISFLFKKIRLD